MTRSMALLLMALLSNHSLDAKELDPMISTRFLKVEGKTLAYDDTEGSGQVVVCIPGLGDTRAQYRILTPLLAKSGFRVITMDPRGQGESEAFWDSYQADRIGDDVAVLVHALAPGKRVILVGASAGAASAAWAASKLRDSVSGLVLVGPFVRDVPPSFFQKLMIQIGFAGPWAISAWLKYYRSLFPHGPPQDLEHHLSRLKSNLREPGRLDALKAMMFASKKKVENRLSEINIPTIVVMGERDSDFKAHEVEARLVAKLTRGEVVMVPLVGHYPHLEAPETILSVIQRYSHD